MLRPIALTALLLTALAAPALAAPPLAERLGDRIVRFWPDSSARADALPSLCLLPQVHSEGPAPGTAADAPSFPSTPGGRSAHIDTPRGASLYGTGMVPGHLLRNGTTTTLWNTDAYGWDGASQSLYQSHPWVLAVRRDGTAFGVIADEPGRLVVDLTDGIAFRSQRSSLSGDRHPARLA